MEGESQVSVRVKDVVIGEYHLVLRCFVSMECGCEDGALYLREGEEVIVDAENTLTALEEGCSHQRETDRSHGC